MTTALAALITHPFPLFLAGIATAAVAYCALRDHITSRRTVAEVVEAADRGAARVAESEVTDFDREFAYENGVLL